jgi:hypothetical protein
MKISAMIFEFASNYIHLGETIEEKQNYLNAACIAWNISILPPNAKQKALSDFLKQYHLQNPEYSVADIQQDIEILMKEKTRLFPDVKIPIVSAIIQKDNETYKILAASINPAQNKK